MPLTQRYESNKGIYHTMHKCDRAKLNVKLYDKLSSKHGNNLDLSAITDNQKVWLLTKHNIM